MKTLFVSCSLLFFSFFVFKLGTLSLSLSLNLLDFSLFLFLFLFTCFTQIIWFSMNYADLAL
jgi:hypothetical protein